MIRLSTRQSTATLGRLRDAIGTGLDELPDAELLERFARYADHPSFEVILRRHGPMVFGVCRRVLANRADAEDAFQAAFLVLVRKARSVRRGDRLGPWLYGVAFRVATKARGRTRRHSEATDMIPDPTPEPPDWLPILDAELSGLPAKYREPMVLCELQGATRAEAAKALRIPEGTLSSRLARGRDLLRKRLLKHGTLLPGGGIAALFTAGGLGRAAVPAGLLAKTSEVAAVVATGTALAGAVPAGPARLTDEVLKGMLLTKLRMMGGAILAAVMIATGVTGVMSGEVPGRGGQPAADVSRPGSAGGSNAADTKGNAPGEGPAGDGSVGHIPSGSGHNTEDYRIQYKALFTKALRVLSEDFEQISSADQYSGRIEARQPLTNRVAVIEIRRSDDGRLAISVSVLQEVAERKQRDIGLERAILQRLNAQTEEQPEKRKTASTATSPAANGQALPDREALQGLWAVEKYDIGKQAKPEELKQAQEAAAQMHVLVVGDVWWSLTSGPNGMISPQLALLDPTKNPKWLDTGDFTPDVAAKFNTRSIYELDGDRLRICMCSTNNPARPAEFNTEDGTELMVLHLRREKLPPAAGEKALVGSWAGELVAKKVGAEKSDRTLTPRVEVYESHLFVSIDGGDGHGWIGGKYTVDATKNPKWVDVELATPTDGGKVTRLYGCYEVTDGRLKLALGTNRATRPLAFEPRADVMLFELKATKEPLATKSATVPAPKPAGVPGSDDRISQLMTARKYAEAEKLLHARMPERFGMHFAEDQLKLGICLVERAKDSPAEADKLRARAAVEFQEVIRRVDEATQPLSPENKHAPAIRTQAEMRLLQVLYAMDKTDELLATAGPLLDKHSNTANGLIVLSLLYHAFKQKGDAERALKARQTMRQLFDSLKDVPDAFTAKTGEFSREYWEKVWFAEK